MAQNDDIAARFADCCEQSNEYPRTILRTETFSHAQKTFQARLNQEGLFHSSRRMLYVRDLQDTATAFDKGRLLEGMKDVETLLDPEEKDPWWRFMSVKLSPSIPVRGH